MADPTARTLALLALLQTHRHWTGADLARRLEVSERTVRRDIDRLRALGYPVHAAPGLDGGYQLAAGTHLPPLVVDDEEAVALAVGLRAAAGAAIEGIDETTVRVMAKLEQVLPDRLRRRVDALHSNVEVLRWRSPDQVPARHLATLATACRDREEVRFDYTRRDGDTARRLVQPLQMVSVGQRWYLVAWDVRRADWRTFRVDRMASPTLAGARFVPRELPAASAADFVTAGLRAAREEFVALVTVEAERLDEVASWFGNHMTRVEGTPKQLRVTSDTTAWLAGMIAVLATSFDIVVDEAPAEVRSLLEAAAGRLTT